MGWSIKKPFKVSSPKITVGNQTVQNAVKLGTGYAAYETTYDQVIKPTVAHVIPKVQEVASSPVGQAAMSAGLTSLGLPPGLASFMQPTPSAATAFVERKEDFAPMPQTQDFAPPSNKTPFIIAGLIAAAGVLIFILKRK